MLTPELIVAHIRRRLGIRRVAASIVIFLGSCIAFFVSRRGPLLVSVLLTFVMGLLAIRLHRVIRSEFEQDVSLLRERVVMIALVVATGAILLGIWRAGLARDGTGFFGFVFIYIAVGVLLQELRSSERLAAWVWAGILVASLFLALASMALVAFGVARAFPLALALAILGVPLGLSLFSERSSRWLLQKRTSVVLRIGALGLAMFLLAMGSVLLEGLGWTYVAVFAAAVLLVMLGIAARTSVDVVFVIAVTAVVWTLTQRSVPEPDELRPERGDRVMAAVGDSFISGEGAEVFFTGTNLQGTDTCRRAPTAYPVLLLHERRITTPNKLLFVACSGALAEEVARASGTTAAAGVDLERSTQLDQLIDELGEEPNVELMLLSAGGNDALFGTVARTCLLPIECTTLEAAWTRHLARVEQTLAATYDEIASRLPDTDVYVVPYPIPISRTRCTWSAFSNKEHAFLVRFTENLNATVTRAASGRDRFFVVDTMPRAFDRDRLRLCDGRSSDAGVNFFATNSVIGTLEQSINPLNWVHNSLHPNAKGHDAMRGAFVAWTSGRGREDARDLAAVPRRLRAAASDSPCADARGNEELEACTSDWTIREIARRVFFAPPGLVAAIALLGAWLFVLALLHVWRTTFA